MKVKTDLRAGSIFNDAASQAKDTVTSATQYLMDTRQNILDIGQAKLNQAREAVQTLVTL